MTLIVRNERASVARVRAAVDAVAAEHGLPAEAAFDLKVATTEALANALRHGTSEGATVDVTLACDPDMIQVEVADHGRFRPAAGLNPERGRGLPLMVALSDEVEFAATARGTRVRIRMRIPREAESEQAVA